jgi:hypothetical protein
LVPGGIHSVAGKGGGGSQFGRDTVVGTLSINILFAPIGYFCRVHAEWQRPLSGLHSII